MGRVIEFHFYTPNWTVTQNLSDGVHSLHCTTWNSNEVKGEAEPKMRV